MVPLKLVRSLVLGNTIHNHLLQTPTHHHQENNNRHKSNTKQQTDTKTPFLIFTPTKELVTDIYKLATLARLIGMDFCPNPSLSHLIFSWHSSSSSQVSYSTSMSLPNGAVSLPYPCIIDPSSVSHLRCFVGISRGFFKLVFLNSNISLDDKVDVLTSNWDCCSFSLVLRMSNCQIESMDCFCKALAGQGWTFFMTKYNPCVDSGERPVWGTNAVYLFRKVESSRVFPRQVTAGGGGSLSGDCRMREMRLPPLDFRNAPLRILQYILLMTDDIFYLA